MALLFRCDAFLDFDGGVKTGRPATIECDAAAKFVDHFNDAVFDNVIDIATEE